MVKLTACDLNDPKDVELIMNAAQKVKSKTNELWQPFHIMSALYSNNAVAMKGSNSDIVVMYRQPRPYTFEQQLWIWIAYSKETNAIEKYWDSIETIAKEWNCDSIAFSSTRTGYNRSNLSKTVNLEREYEQFRIKINK